MANTPNERELSRKECARQIRRAACLRAKERRATDPRFLSMKEAAKRHRRDAYQVAKDRMKAATVAKLGAERGKDEARRAAKRVAADERLRSKVRFASKPQ